MKLANIRNTPPNGFLFEQTQTGWKNWIASPNSIWDFQLLCTELLAHRQANHTRFPYLNLDMGKIKEEVEHANALRVSKIPGAESYVDKSGGAQPNFPNPHSLRLRAVGASVAKLATGAGVLLDWLGSGGVPVESSLAEKRASTCSACPENGDGNLSKIFTVPISNMIRRQLESRKELKLATSKDDKLGICKVCLCPLPLKVWVPIDSVKEHVSEEIRAQLPAFCWMKTEA